MATSGFIKMAAPRPGHYVKLRVLRAAPPVMFKSHNEKSVTKPGVLKVCDVSVKRVRLVKARGILLGTLGKDFKLYCRPYKTSEGGQKREILFPGDLPVTKH